MRILLTGIAGFIGFHLTKKLLEENHYTILGIDNLNSYYPVQLKVDRLKQLGFHKDVINSSTVMQSNDFSNLTFSYGDISDNSFIEKCFNDFKPEIVIHLAAQAGVRYSLENPDAYIQSNINGFYNVISNAKKFGCNNFVYASSSSVYGNDLTAPYSESMNVDHPVSLYAATKKSNELIAHTFSHLYGMKTIGLRFFTVYGPFGRPDMAYFSFVKAILNNKPIKVFNKGNLKRDFTFIDDVTESIGRLVGRMTNESYKGQSYEIFNVGNSSPVMLMDFINEIENVLQKEAVMEFIDMQAGDVLETHADNSHLEEIVEFKPSNTLSYGLTQFVNWYKSYYED